MSGVYVLVDGLVRSVSTLLADGDANTKLRKSANDEFVTMGLSLAPWMAGGANVCPHASPGCILSCVGRQGLASVFKDISLARRARTRAFYEHREWFMARLDHELAFYSRKAEKAGKRLAVRLNMYSDLPWEKWGIIDAHPNIEFYDYSKNPNRIGQIRPNYWTTFSRSEANEVLALGQLARGNNVAVAFADASNPRVGNRAGEQSLPSRWHGFDVISGDDTDLRFDDPKGGFVIGLKLKASTWASREASISSGFAVVR